MTPKSPPIQLVRGRNPEPDAGWPWHLTDYEVAYVRAYNVRPVRVGSWTAAPDAEHRLEQEAQGVRFQRDRAYEAAPPLTPAKVSWGRKPVHHAWPWITLASIFVAVGLFFCVGSLIQNSQTHALEHSTAKLKEETRDDN